MSGLEDLNRQKEKHGYITQEDIRLEINTNARLFTQKAEANARQEYVVCCERSERDLA